MSRRSRRAGQLATLALVGLLVVAFPAGFVLAQDLADPGATTQSNHTLVPFINLTSTPTETPTATPTQTATPIPTATASPTPDSVNNKTNEGSNTRKTHFVNAGAGIADGATSDEEGCNNPEYTTIQAGVDAADPGDTVHVCGGDYQSVTIEKAKMNLTLEAENGAVIESAGEPAIRSNASGVTIRGFTMRTTGAAYTLAVGGVKTVIRDNTINITTHNSTGIFLSDGLTPMSGDPDPDLGVATASRVLNNTIHVTQASNQNEIYRAVLADADKTVVRDNTILPNDDTLSIHSVGNKTIIQQNAIRNPKPCRQQEVGTHNPSGDCYIGVRPPAIVIGKQTFKRGCAAEVVEEVHATHNWARRNQIGNNSISHIPGYGISIRGTGNESKALAAIEGAVIQNNHLYQTGGIVGWTEGAVFENNTVDVDNSRSGEASSSEGSFPEAGLHLCAHNTRVIGNTITDYWRKRVFVGRNISITNNTFRGGNLNVLKFDEFSQDTVREHPTIDIRFINNTVQGSTLQEGVRIQHNVSITEFAYNQITGNGRGVSIETFNSETNHNMYDVTIKKFHHNTIVDNRGYGVENDGRIVAFHHNKITGNDETGVILTKEGTISGFHFNIIDNNGYLGIHKRNQDKADGNWSIVNATYNFWGCGGPSGGLEDPKTGRVANGSGDRISASDDAGVSNVNFDPFFVREGLTCPAGMSNPTPTHTPTPTPTPTPPPGDNSGGDDGNRTGDEGGDVGTGGEGAGGGDGAGSGDGSSDGEGSGDSSGGESESGGERTTPLPAPPSPTDTPRASPTDTPTVTTSQSDTPTPTPVVEPGFGIGTWLLGVALVASLLVIRRREVYHE